MKKIKILFEGISQNLGGIETFVYNLCKNLDTKKYEIFFLVDKNIKIAYYDEYIKNGYKFFYTENRKKNYFKYLNDLKDIYSNNEFDIIHINVMSYSLFERIEYACKYSNAKIIVHSHTSGYKKGYYKTRLLNKIGKFVLRNYDYNMIACGEKAGQYLFKKNKFKIINNGIDFKKFAFSNNYRKEIRKQLNISDETKLIGMIGTFFPVKNHEFIIKIFKKYNQINPDSKLLLIGEGPLKEKIKKQVNNEGLQEKVIFAGKKDDVYKIYSSLDLYLMPSISEGLSISLCEAQINGLKCYTSSGVDKNSDISKNVIFIELEKSPQYWAEQMIKNDKRDNKVLEKIPDKFNLEKSCKIICDYYDSLINKQIGGEISE